jgi:hypothetical protein
MKFKGFLKEQDRNIRGAKHLNEMLLSEPHDNFEKKELINYLRKGILLVGVLSYIYDIDGSPIGNLDYLTDGEFVWPTYLQ